MGVTGPGRNRGTLHLARNIAASSGSGVAVLLSCAAAITKASKRADMCLLPLPHGSGWRDGVEGRGLRRRRGTTPRVSYSMGGEALTGLLYHMVESYDHVSSSVRRCAAAAAAAVIRGCLGSGHCQYMKRKTYLKMTGGAWGCAPRHGARACWLEWPRAGTQGDACPSWCMRRGWSQSRRCTCHAAVAPRGGTSMQQQPHGCNNRCT